MKMRIKKELQHINKLVRDNIPGIILAEGKCVEMRKLSKEEYIKELIKKLREETDEFEKALNIEEYVDLLEVLQALKSACNLDDSTIKEMALKKRERLGGFEDRMYIGVAYILSDIDGGIKK